MRFPQSSAAVWIFAALISGFVLFSGGFFGDIPTCYWGDGLDNSRKAK
jgi:hypothetical protein